MIMNSGVFFSVEFQFYTVHPLLSTTKTFSEFSKAGIKVTMIKCYIYVGVISIQMEGDIETGNNDTDGGTVKGKKEGTQDRIL